MLLWGLAVLYLLALGGLLWVTRYKTQYYTQAKGFTSLLFVLAGFLSWRLGARHARAEFALLITALVLCALGDVLLGLANRGETLRMKPFLCGTGSFMLAHVLFCVLFYRQVGFAWYDVLLPLALLVTTLILDAKKVVHLGRMKIPGCVYTLLVGLMCTKALEAAFVAGAVGYRAVLTAVGAVLFLTSDVVLLFLYFATNRQKWHRYVNLSTYYAGIYLLASTAYWM